MRDFWRRKFWVPLILLFKTLFALFAANNVKLYLKTALWSSTNERADSRQWTTWSNAGASQYSTRPRVFAGEYTYQSSYAGRCAYGCFAFPRTSRSMGRRGELGA